MSNQVFVWNASQTRKIKLSTVKEFIVRGYGQVWEVVAMLSGNDHTLLYTAETKEEAQEFVDDITRADK